MLRTHFEEHAIWDQVTAARNVIDQLEQVAEADEIPVLRRLDFLLTYVESYRALAPAFSEFFNDSLIAPVSQTLSAVVSQLQQRASGLSYRQYSDHALTNAENLLPQVALWPRPYAKGAQVQQMTTFYEELRVSHERDLAQLERKQAEVMRDIDTHASHLAEIKRETVSELQALRAQANQIAEDVDHQKARIDEVVEKGLERINDLTLKNSETFELWKVDQQNEWDAFAHENQRRMDGAVDAAAESLTRIKSNEKEYANLITALTGRKLAAEFNDEAQSSKWIGLIVYGLGFVALSLGALPLFFLMGEQSAEQSTDVTWQHFAIRLALGILGASAATVLIRLGGRFLASSTASKRMALELQTFGPFLANVKDKATVDAARLELIDRAFGKSYAPGEPDANSEVLPVSALSQVVEMVKTVSSK